MKPNHQNQSSTTPRTRREDSDLLTRRRAITRFSILIPTIATTTLLGERSVQAFPYLAIAPFVSLIYQEIKDHGGFGRYLRAVQSILEHSTAQVTAADMKRQAFTIIDKI